MSTATTPKTQQEIRARFDGLSDDWLGFKAEALIEAMQFDTAADLLKEGVTESDWHQVDVKKTATEYLELAIDKATGHRGISASRSIEKFGEWLWCLGDEDLQRRFEDTEYAPYGAPQLAVLAEAWDVHTADMDTETWRRMSAGRACSDDCMEGC